MLNQQTKKFPSENKLKLREYILEKQKPFTISELCEEVDMERRSLARFILTMIDEGYLYRKTGREYAVVKLSTSWKIN